MKRRRWRTSARMLVAMLATVSALSASAQTSTTTKPPATPVGVPYTYADYEGKLIAVATELPADVKQLIDGARRLQEEPGLILDRAAIYKTLNVRVESSRSSKDIQGLSSTREQLVRQGPSGRPDWHDRLEYDEFPKSDSRKEDAWVVRVILEFQYGEGLDPCYTSRLVEAYWGKPFVYRPWGVHEQLREMTMPSGASPTGPHDGRPYNADFPAPHKDGASVWFSLGRGGCLSSIHIGRVLQFKEYGNDHVYHQ